MTVGAGLMGRITDPSTASRALHWILRVSVFMCFVGHGAFGIIQKPEWLAFVRPFGFSDETGFMLMPLIGTMDISLGILALVRPTRAALMYCAAWAVFTAALRPVAGGSFFEVLERGGNFGPAIALLVGTAGASLLARVAPPRVGDAVNVLRLRRVLVFTTFLLLLGHGALALLGKPLLVKHWASVGIGGDDGSALLFTRVAGGLEVFAAFVVLLRPTVALCLAILAWKVCTEWLFVTAGAPIWEWVERGGSYGAPLALAVVLAVSARAVSVSASREPEGALQVQA